MSEEEDIDLLALQRQLDDAFETTRPRRGFEDELWLRMQSRRPFWQRLQDVLAGMVETLREVPAVPAAAVATVLILAIGIGVLARSGVHFGGFGGGASTATSAVAPAGSKYALAPSAFGRLPSVALYPGVAPPHVKGSPYPVNDGQPAVETVPTNLYFGPASLSWTGQLPTSGVPALVFRYNEPTQAQADQFATSLGAASSNQAQAASGYLGIYTGQGFSLAISSSSSVPSREPRFGLVPTETSPGGSDAKAVAMSFLAMHSLLPTWPYAVDISTTGNQVRVQLDRAFPLPNGQPAYLVGGLGERYGIDVFLQGGQPPTAQGPLPLNLDSASYPLITAGQAVQKAVTSSPTGSQVISPTPVVQLNRVELVYALAVSGGQGFYEPAYLFSGTFHYQGQTMEKRVLVPAVDPSQLNS